LALTSKEKEFCLLHFLLHKFVLGQQTLVICAMRSYASRTRDFFARRFRKDFYFRSGANEESSQTINLNQYLVTEQFFLVWQLLLNDTLIKSIRKPLFDGRKKEL